jgi:protein TonB
LKWNSVQLAFCASVTVHAAILGVASVTMVAWHEPTLEPEGTVTALTLVAAPEIYKEPPPRPDNATPVAPPVPAVPEIVRPLEPVKLTAPVEQAPPTIQASAPAPVAAAPPQSVIIDARGDGSSPTPGADTSTVQAQPGIKAEANYLANPVPSYPLLARHRHQEGLVLLTVTVTPQGRPASITIKQNSGFPLLDDAALQSVRNWEFQPARINSLAVESEIEVPIRFKLE